MIATAPVPGPWVDPTVAGPEPWKTREGIVKFIEFPVRIPRMSRRAFHLYWQRHHSPHVMNCTGFSQFMRKYVTTHAFPDPVDFLPPHFRPAARLEGAAEVWLSSLREAVAWLSHPLYPELIQPDEPRFIDQSSVTEIVIVREEPVLRGELDLAETGLIKVHAIYRRAGSLPPDEFHRRLSDAGRALVAGERSRERLRQFTISHRLCDPQPEGFPIAPIDAVAEFWFETLAHARDFFASAEYAAGYAHAEASLCEGGTARAVVAQAHVVHDEFSFQSTLMQPQRFEWSSS